MIERCVGIIFFLLALNSFQCFLQVVQSFVYCCDPVVCGLDVFGGLHLFSLISSIAPWRFKSSFSISSRRFSNSSRLSVIRWSLVDFRDSSSDGTLDSFLDSLFQILLYGGFHHFGIYVLRYSVIRCLPVKIFPTPVINTEFFYSSSICALTASSIVAPSLSSIFSVILCTRTLSVK